METMHESHLWEEQRMKTDARPFRYDGDRSVYMSTAMAFGFLILMESSLVALLIFFLVKTAWLSGLLLFALVLLNLGAIAKLRQPLRTTHLLTADTLCLRYGKSFQVDLPRASLVAAQPVQEPVSGFATLNVRYDAGRDRVVALFSSRGQVLLTLGEPHHFSLGGLSQTTTRHVLINVDERDAFLAALALPGTAPQSAGPIADWSLSPRCAGANSASTIFCVHFGQRHGGAAPG